MTTLDLFTGQPSARSPQARAWDTMRALRKLDPETASLERKLTASISSSIGNARRRQERLAAKGRSPVAVTITVEQLMAKLRANNYRCAATGLPFWQDDADRFGPSCPSIDRLDVDGPYSDENTRVV
jgi:hypothetical protein